MLHLSDARQGDTELRQLRLPSRLDVGMKGVHMLQAPPAGSGMVIDPLYQYDRELLPIS